MKPLNGSWLFNVDFEEIDTALAYAKFEKNKVTKQPELESVIKNKFLQEITMKTKLKIGDKVLLTKPIKRHNSDALEWYSGVDALLGNVLIVKRVDLDDNTYYCEFEGTYFWCCESWLTKVEEGIITEEPKAEETKTIDWEARRWEMASKIFAETEDITLDSAVRQADVFIKYYKQTLK